MLRGVHTKINLSLNLSRVDLKVDPAKEEKIANDRQFFWAAVIFQSIF